MKSPAFRFYPGDFWASPDVQTMELAEVGAYISLLSAAWLSEQPGRLQNDDNKLRRWARMTREQWAESRDVLLAKFPEIDFSWRENPRLYREAQKQEAYSASQSAKGKKGGRPKAGEKLELSDEKHRLSSGLSPEKPSVSVSVSKKTNTNTKALSPSAPPPSCDECSEFLEAWNSNCGTLPKVVKISAKRAKRLSVRTKAGLSLEDFTSAVQKAARTPFLRGVNDRNWKCDFDFLLDEEHFLKVIEGTYGEPDLPKKEYVDVTDTPAADGWLTGGVHA